MGTISRPTKVGGGTVYVTGRVLYASDLNGDIDTLYNEFNGSINNNNIDPAAGIDGSKVTPSFATAVQLPNNIGLQNRNAGNTAYVDLIKLNGSDVVQVANGGQASTVGGALTVTGLVTANGGVTIPTGQNLVVTDAPASGTEAANKTYVDSEISAALASGVIPSGTVMLFYQAAAPTGWTKLTTQNDKVLRVVSGTGGGTGGSWTISGLTNASVSTGLTVDNHTLTLSQVPSHSHFVARNTSNSAAGPDLDANDPLAYTRGATDDGDYNLNKAGGTTANVGPTNSQGGGGAHNHNTTESAHTHVISADGAWRPAYIDVIICSRD